MLFTSPAEQSFARAISDLLYCNPFTEQRVTASATRWARTSSPPSASGSRFADSMSSRPNIGHLAQRVDEFAKMLRRRLVGKASQVPTNWSSTRT